MAESAAAEQQRDEEGVDPPPAEIPVDEGEDDAESSKDEIAADEARHGSDDPPEHLGEPGAVDQVLAKRYEQEIEEVVAEDAGAHPPRRRGRRVQEHRGGCRSKGQL